MRGHCRLRLGSAVDERAHQELKYGVLVFFQPEADEGVAFALKFGCKVSLV